MSFVELSASIATGIGIVIGIFTLIEKFSGAMGRWVQRQIEASKTARLVEYHLGPNGKTRPIHQRLMKLEEAHGIDCSDDEP